MVQVNVQVKLLQGRTPLLFAWWNKAEGTVNACLVSCPCQDLELTDCVAKKPHSSLNDKNFDRALQSSEVISIIDEECAPDFSLVAALKQYRAINAAKKKITLANSRREKKAAANWRIHVARRKAKKKASRAEKAGAVGQEEELLHGSYRGSKTQGTAYRKMANDNKGSKTKGAAQAVEVPTRGTSNVVSQIATRAQIPGSSSIKLSHRAPITVTALQLTANRTMAGDNIGSKTKGAAQAVKGSIRWTRNVDGKIATTPLMPGSSLSQLSDSYHYAITPPTTYYGSKEITSVGATMSTAIRSRAMASNGTQHKHMIVGGTPEGTTRADGQSTAGPLVPGRTPGASTANTLGTLSKVTGGTLIRDISTYTVIGGTPEGTMSADGQSTAGPLMSGQTPGASTANTFIGTLSKVTGGTNIGDISTHTVIGDTPKGTMSADGRGTARPLMSGQTPGASTANTFIGTLSKVTGGTNIGDISTHTVIGGTPKGTMSADGRGTARPLVSGQTPGASTANTFIGTLSKVTGGTNIRNISTHTVIGSTPKGTMSADGRGTARPLVSGQTPGASTANTFIGTLSKVTGGTNIGNISTCTAIGGTPKGTMSADGQSIVKPLMSGLTPVTPSSGQSGRTNIAALTTIPAADRTVNNVNKENRARDTPKVIVGVTPRVTNNSQRYIKPGKPANLLLKLSNGAVLEVPLAMLKSKFPTTSLGGTTGRGGQGTVRSNLRSKCLLKLSNGTTVLLPSSLFAGDRTIARDTSEGSLQFLSNLAQNISTSETHDDSSNLNTEPATSSTVGDRNHRSKRKRKAAAKCVNSSAGANGPKKVRIGSPPTDGYTSLETTGAPADLAPFPSTANDEKGTKPQVKPRTKKVKGARPNDPNHKKQTKIQAKAKKVSGALPNRKKQTRSSNAKTEKAAPAPTDRDKRKARKGSGSSDPSSPKGTTDMSAGETSGNQGGDNKPVSKATLKSILTICELCGKSVTNRYLPRHNKAYHHQGERERPHKCHLCDASFLRRQHLRRHIRVVHELFRYKCRFCDKWLTNNFGRRLHENTHFPKDEPIFPYKRTYKKKRVPFKNHEMLKNRTTVCELCGLIVKKYRIHEHHRNHKRPYPCNQCGRFYNNWELYVMHMNKQHPERPWIPKIVDPSQPDSVQDDALLTVADNGPLPATTTPATTAEDDHQTPHTDTIRVDVSLDEPPTEKNTINQKTKSKKKRKKKDKDREKHKRSKKQKKTINTDPEAAKLDKWEQTLDCRESYP